MFREPRRGTPVGVDRNVEHVVKLGGITAKLDDSRFALYCYHAGVTTAAYFDPKRFSDVVEVILALDKARKNEDT